MSQVGSNLQFSQLNPLRPGHTDQSQACVIDTELQLYEGTNKGS